MFCLLYKKEKACYEPMLLCMYIYTIKMKNNIKRACFRTKVGGGEFFKSWDAFLGNNDNNS